MKTRIGLVVLLAVALTLSVVASARSLSPALPAALQLLGAPAAPAVLLLALALHLVGHLVRSEKHWVLLQEIRPIGRAQVFRGQMIGFMFNALLPARAGELVRAHYVGRSVQISRAAVFATIALERVVDLVVVGALGVVGALMLASPAVDAFWALPAFALVSAALIAGVLAVCYVQPRWFLTAVYRATGVFNERVSTRARQIVWSFCHALVYALPSRNRVVRYVVLSLVMWVSYLGSTAMLCLLVLGAGLRPGTAVTGIVAPFLGVTGWTGPAVFGSFAARFESVLLAQPGSSQLATLAWGLLVLPSILLGIVCLLHRRLVEHTQGLPEAPLLRNKLFRGVYGSTEFSHLFATHFQGQTLSRIISREESSGRFTVIRALKGGSNASTLLVWQDGEVVVKKLTLPAFSSKLDSQYRWLHGLTDQRQVVGALGRTEHRDHYSIDIEYRESYVSFFEHLHATTKQQAWSVLSQMLDFMGDHVYRSQPVADAGERVSAYLREKVLGKIQDAAAVNVDLAHLAACETVTINGEEMLGLSRVLEAIAANPEAMSDLESFEDGPIHGDLTIDNLMVDPRTDDFMVIDPNDENLISDMVVDYAKLMQSLHSGYEFLMMQTRVEMLRAGIRFEERRSAHYEFLYSECRNRFEQTLSGARYRSLLFHEAVHYCRMLTYRVAIDPHTAPMYFAVALRLFNRFLEQYAAGGSATPSHVRAAAGDPLPAPVGTQLALSSTLR